jgi:hypothetical protein
VQNLDTPDTTKDTPEKKREEKKKSRMLTLPCQTVAGDLLIYFVFFYFLNPVTRHAHAASSD